MLLKDIRKDLEQYKNYQIIYNITTSGSSYFEHEYNTVEELLKYPDYLILPYECYEVVKDWDDWGYGDGRDSICFYTKAPGFFESHPNYKGYK